MVKSAQFCLPLTLILYSVFSVVFIVHQVDGFFARALPGINCIESYPPGKLACDVGNCQFNKSDNVFQLACNTDCISQHGATYGYCLPSNICNCGPAEFVVKKDSLQCRDLAEAQLYQTICEEDCWCTHNKQGGGCNFYTRVCECGPTYQSPKLNCPYKTSNEYFLKLLERYTYLKIPVVDALSG